MSDTFKTPEHKRAYFKQWYARNKERQKAYARAYAKEYKNKGCWDTLGPADLEYIQENSETMRVCDIARALGVSHGSISYHIKKNNWPRYNPQSVKQLHA